MNTCKVKGCRFRQFHTTIGHKCGTCGEYGHGQLECGNIQMINELKNRTQYDRLPQHKHCTILGCRFFWSHTNQSHHCSMCGGRNHSQIECNQNNISIPQVNLSSPALPQVNLSSPALPQVNLSTDSSNTITTNYVFNNNIVNNADTENEINDDTIINDNKYNIECPLCRIENSVDLSNNKLCLLLIFGQ